MQSGFNGFLLAAIRVIGIGLGGGIALMLVYILLAWRFGAEKREAWKWKRMPAKFQAELAGSPTEEVRVALAKHPRTAARMLAELADANQPVAVRAALAKNPNTNPTTLAKLAKDEDQGVVDVVAGNGSVRRETVDQLFGDKGNWKQLAKNPNLPQEMVLEIARRGSFSAQEVILFHPALPEGEQLRLAVEGTFKEMPPPDHRRCASARVEEWRSRRTKVEMIRTQGPGLTSSTWRGVRLEIQFSRPEQTTLAILHDGREGREGSIYGWWEEGMGESWLCLIDDWHHPRGIKISQGAETMAITTFFEVDKEKSLWLHTPWDIFEEGGTLVARCSVTKLDAEVDVPELPNFQPAYPGGGTPYRRRGCLLYQGEVLELWVDAEGREVSWKKQDDDGTPLVFDENQWAGFEGVLRKLAFGAKP